MFPKLCEKIKTGKITEDPQPSESDERQIEVSENTDSEDEVEFVQEKRTFLKVRSDESLLATPSTSESEKKVPCPVCGVEVPERNVNNHLDRCLFGKSYK